MSETDNQAEYAQTEEEIEQRYQRRINGSRRTFFGGMIIIGSTLIGSAILSMGAPHNEIRQKYNQASTDVAILREIQRNYPPLDISRISSKDLAEQVRAQFPQVDLERDKALTSLVNEAQARVNQIESSDDYVSSQSYARRMVSLGTSGLVLGTSVVLAALCYVKRQSSKKENELQDLYVQRKTAQRTEKTA